MTFDECNAKISKMGTVIGMYNKDDKKIRGLFVAPVNQSQEVLDQWIAFYMESRIYPPRPQTYNFDIWYEFRQNAEDDGSVLGFHSFSHDFPDFRVE